MTHMTDISQLTDGDQANVADLATIGEELPEELLDLVTGGRMAVMPTYCTHSDPPHICDHVTV